MSYLFVDDYFEPHPAKKEQEMASDVITETANTEGVATAPQPPGNVSTLDLTTKQGDRWLVDRAALREEVSICIWSGHTWSAHVYVTHEEAAKIAAAASPITAELLACLKEALELIQSDIDNRDGRDNFDMACGNCDGAIPVNHSFGCRAKEAIRKAEGIPQQA